MTSSAPLGVCLLLVLAHFAVSVLAITHCNQTIIDNLGSHYCRGGTVIPPQRADGERAMTRLFSTKGDVPKDVVCITTFFQYSGETWEYAEYLKNGKRNARNHPKVTHKIQKDHILEIAHTKKKEKYRLYVIHNESNVYTYYKCIESGAEGNGQPMVATYIGCNHVEERHQEYSFAQRALRDAKPCFREMGIPKSEIVAMDPCWCTQYT